MISSQEDLIPVPTTGEPMSDEATLRTLVLWSEGVISAQQASLVLGMQKDVMFTLATTPIWQVRVEVESARLREKLVEAKALRGLDAVVARVARMVESDDLSVGVLTTAGEFLRKSSGTEQRRAAELRVSGEQASGFSVQVVFDGEDPAPTGNHCVVLRVGKRRPAPRTNLRSGYVIDAE